ncbi:MAG: phosphonate metabolism transcriptional regulator PhnF [Pseudomonadota bacterium]
MRDVSMTTEGDAADSGVSRWRRVHDALAADLAAGVVPIGARLPGESALARRFGVNRHTVRRALQALAAAGRIRTEHGRGSFVLADPVRYTLSRRTRFGANLADQGLTARRVVQTIEQAQASAAVARALDLARGAPVIEAVCLAYADGSPLARSLHRFPPGRLPGIARALRETGGITAALAALGHGDFVRASTTITARPASELEARLLALPPKAPMLVTEGLDVAADGTPLQLVVTAFAGSRVELIVGA